MQGSATQISLQSVALCWMLSSYLTAGDLEKKSIIYYVCLKKCGSILTTLLNKPLLQKIEDNLSKFFLLKIPKFWICHFCFAELARKISLRRIMHCQRERLWKGTAMFCMLRCAWLFLPCKSVVVVAVTVLPAPSLGGDVEEFFWANGKWGLCEVLGLFVSKCCTKALV